MSTHAVASVRSDCAALYYRSTMLPVHGVLQARIRQWGAAPLSGHLLHLGLEPGSPALQADSLPSEPSGK